MGDGSEKKYLMSLVSDLNLQNDILILPFQKNAFAIIKKCDVFVMPSMYEGYCNALCEALICGLPCIATDFQTSARDILAPDTPFSYQNMDKIEHAKYGVIVPVCSGNKYSASEPLGSAENMLADAMIEICNDIEMYNRYKQLAPERGLQFDIKQKVNEWLKVVYGE